ncbi:MAG: hypothetical protein AAB225_24550 [Acidobacteriota bacterium]
MATGTESPRELRSWKEIAAFLGVTVRTAQLWEGKKGLPVRRIAGKPGLVFADPAEVAAWKTSGPPAPQPLPTSRLRRLWPALLMLSIAGASLALFMPKLNGPPAALSLQDNTLIVSDQAGRELWRKTIGRPLQAGLHTRLAPGQSHNWPVSWVGDLDGDGRTEVLFVHSFYPDTSTGSTPLVCYSDRGVEKWRFVPNRVVATLADTFGPIYNTWQIAVFSLRDGSRAVLVSSPHYHLYPHQIALLSPRGELLREYWHSGQFYRMEVADADGDGGSEIYRVWLL